MKKLTVVLPVVLLVAGFFVLEPVFGDQINAGRHYTRGISNTRLTIPRGFIIAEAVLTIHSITNINENDSDALQVYLSDNTPLGFTTSDGTKDKNFENQDLLLTPIYHDQTPGYEDLIYTFSNLNDEASSVWDVFNPDNPNMAGYSSLLLQLIDCAGNGTDFGFGFEPNGNSGYSFEKLSLELMIVPFNSQQEPYIITLQTSLLEPIGDKTVDEKRTLSFEVITTGAEGEPITCWAENLPEDAIFDGYIFTWRPWYGDAGTYDVTFVASDGFQEDSQTITITVNRVKSAGWYERWRKHLSTF